MMFLFLLFFNLISLPACGSRNDKALHALVERCLKIDSSAWVTHFELRETPAAGLGVFSSSDMKEGQVLFELPPALHVNVDFVSSYLPYSITRSGVESQVLIAVWLAYERFGKWPPRGWFSALFASPSFDGTFTALMPARVDNAVHWPREKRLSLPGIHDLEEQWGLLAPVVNLTQPEFFWGYSMLLSRSFLTRRGATLYPLADLLNHCGKRANVELKVGYAEDSDVQFVLTTNVTKGQELCINYGDGKSSDQLWAAYGFRE